MLLSKQSILVWSDTTAWFDTGVYYLPITAGCLLAFCSFISAESPKWWCKPEHLASVSAQDLSVFLKDEFISNQHSSLWAQGVFHNKIYAFSRNSKASLRLTKEACADFDECFFTRFFLNGRCRSTKIRNTKLLEKTALMLNISLLFSTLLDPSNGSTFEWVKINFL